MKRSARACGSITVYFSLILTVMTALICTSIVSVKVSAGRMQAANAVDQAMFSLFARYDRTLAEKYDLFFVNAGTGGGGPNIPAVIEELRDAAEYVLDPGKGSVIPAGRNLLALSIAECGLKGYTLATDGGGAPFAAQACDAVRDTALIDGIYLLRGKVLDGDRKNESGRALMEAAKAASYDEILRKVREAKEEERKKREAAWEAGEIYVPEKPEIPEGFKNPLPALMKIRRRSLMKQVVPSDSGISKRKAGRGAFPSDRKLASGMGMIDTSGGTGTGASGLAFKAYASSRYSSYTSPSPNSALAYQKEYILYGNRSDEANLKAVVKRLMVMRELANIACLYSDPEKSSELSGAALIIGTMLFIPEAEPLIKLILAGVWAYAESIVDVRALLTGYRVPYIKTAADWQTDLAALAGSGGRIEAMVRDAPGGMDYDEYLTALILTSSGGKLVKRAMDMTESELRGMGREDFRLDECICAIETHIEIRSEKKVTFPVEMTMNYRDL